LQAQTVMQKKWQNLSLKKNVQDLRRQIQPMYESIRQRLMTTGIDALSESLTILLDKIEERKAQLEKELAQLNFGQCIAVYQKAERSLSFRIMHAFSQDGKARQDLENALKNEACLRVASMFGDQVKALISMPDAIRLTVEPVYQLKSHSALLANLQEIAISEIIRGR